jgi:hypothetical protein
VVNSVLAEGLEYMRTEHPRLLWCLGNPYVFCCLGEIRRFLLYLVQLIELRLIACCGLRFGALSTLIRKEKKKKIKRKGQTIFPDLSPSADNPDVTAESPDHNLDADVDADEEMSLVGGSSLDMSNPNELNTSSANDNSDSSSLNAVVDNGDNSVQWKNSGKVKISMRLKHFCQSLLSNDALQYLAFALPRLVACLCIT